MKLLKGIGIGLVVLVITFMLGPKPNQVEIDNIPSALEVPLEELSEFVKDTEDATENLKPGNAAEIVWKDSVMEQTPYSIVYLHGFSASHEEGAPLHREMARRYGMNLYLARIDGHGTDEPDPFKTLTVAGMLASAKEAIAIGKLLGEKVIVMSCSTGGTFSLYLAANDPDIVAQILYSPNIDLYDNTSEVLVMPWGLQLARQITNGNSRSFEADTTIKKYWTTTYRLEGLIALKQLLKATMIKETFQAIHQPTFIGYYYKNEVEQDNIISIPKILEMSEQLATPSDQKMVVPFPNVGFHGLNSKYRSQDLASVRKETILFLEEIIGLTPKQRD
jgi:esterase/lipase